MRRTAALDSVALLFFTALLIWPLFGIEYLAAWGSIDSTFIADARMLAGHLPHPGWQPLWYGGTRFDYIYPPALRYGTALLSLVGHISTARAYHLYTATLYVVGTAAVYGLVRTGSASRKTALFAASAWALVSPCFLFLSALRHDSVYLMPQRLHVLAAYGEGPHISALSVLPAALAASLSALRFWRPRMLVLAGALCALVVANNFYGATALALFFPVLAWSVWTGERSRYVCMRAAAIAALAWGLCAFWLTPSYLRITVLNLKWVATPGNTWSLFVAAAVIAVFCIGSFWYANRRQDRIWTIFTVGSAIILSLDVLGYFYFGFKISGDSQRLAPEFDLAVIIFVAEGIRLAWKRKDLRAAAVLVALAVFAPSVRYLPHAWFPFPQSGPLSEQVEYRTSQWVAGHLPGARVLPTGSIRFWFDAWSDNAQIDGGSLQGMLNQIIPAAIWQITRGDRPEPAILWLQALGTDAMVVPDTNSPEVYHDFSLPHKFRGALPAIYDDGKGTVVYRVARVHPGIGRVVNTKDAAAVGTVRGGDDVETLAKYVAVVEHAGQPATRVSWRDFDDMNVQARVAAGQSLLLQETYDDSWEAHEGERSLPIRREPVMGFMLIDVPPGDHAIALHFATPLENRVGQGACLLTLIVAAGLLFAPMRYKGTRDSGPPAVPSA